MMKLSAKKVDSLELLEKKRASGLEIFGNKNGVSSFDEDTEILIIGTYIPHELPYFYFGKQSNRIYGSIIDVARKTNFKQRRKAILDNQDDSQLISQFINELKKEKIAFMDLFKYTLIVPDDSKDKNIVGFVLDEDSIKKAIKSESLRLIVPISRDAEEILVSMIGKDPRIEYHQLINGGTNAEWIELFQRKF